MKRLLILTLSIPLIFASCVSKKKYAELEEKYNDCDDKLSSAKLELASCLEDKEAAKKEISYLKNTNYKLLNSVGEMATLSKQEAENLERSLESIQEKDLQIKTLNEAITKKDSVTWPWLPSSREYWATWTTRTFRSMLKKVWYM